MKLVKYDGNWADEMDISGFRVFTNEAWNEYLEAWGKEEYPYSFYVGTNEEVEIYDFEELVRDFTVKDITDKEAAVIVKFFGKDYGFFP
jgi:hypothetical protein